MFRLGKSKVERDSIKIAKNSAQEKRTKELSAALERSKKEVVVMVTKKELKPTQQKDSKEKKYVTQGLPDYVDLMTKRNIKKLTTKPKVVSF